VDYETIINWDVPEVVQTYDERDTMLYALGVGYGFDPMDGRQLRFVYEDGLIASPSMASILGYPGLWMSDPGTGIDWVRTVHAEQAMTLHGPLPVAGTVVGRTRVTAVVDKGPGKGALVYQERLVNDAATGQLLATVEPVNFCRGDGGLARSDEVRPPPAQVPDRAPDHTCEIPTIPQAALLYRLSGDRNPLHADPQAASHAGFERPILHGMCTFGLAVHALLRVICGYDTTRLRHVRVRFSAPVFPGETLRTEVWVQRDDLRFRATVVERDVVVLSHGSAEVTGL
jgi:acyl dehydratase